MGEFQEMYHVAQLSRNEPARVAGGGAATFLAATACCVLLLLIWGCGGSLILFVVSTATLITILIAAVATSLGVASPAPVSRRVEVQVGVQRRSLPLTLFERFFAVSVLFYSTGAFWRILQGSRDTESGTWTGALMTNFLWLAAYSTALLLLNRCGDVPWHLRKKALVLLLPMPVALVSLLWSQDRVLTFLRCGALIGTTVIALYFALRFTIREILHFSAFALGLAAISSIIAAVGVPSFGIGKDDFLGIWLGVFAQKNELGGMMTLGFVIYLLLAWHERSWRFVRLAMATLCLFLVLKADSMTSLAICCILPYVFWVSKKTLTKKVHVATRMLYFGSPMLIAIAGVVLEFDRIVEVMGRSADLTGRTVLWATIAPAIFAKPYLGYGYEAFWIGYQGVAGEIWEKLGNYYYYSHNGFLEVLLGLGLVGLVSMLIALFFFSKGAIRLLQGGTAIAAFWPWAFLMYLLLSNLLEGNLMKSNNLPWLLYMITALSICVSQNRPSAEAPEQAIG